MIIRCKPLFNKILTGFAGIMILGILFVKDKNNERLINHEKIHVRQFLECLILAPVFYWLGTEYWKWFYLAMPLGFYIWYGIEFLIRFIQYRDTKKAYENISFEREAYKHEMNFNYLRDRKFFRFLKYL